MATIASEGGRVPSFMELTVCPEREQTHRRHRREDGLDQRLGSKLRLVVLPSGLELRRGVEGWGGGTSA